MKTRELIRRLQEADPSGEAECCVGNKDIHFVSNEPAYYDGCLQVLKRDEACKFYNIIGAEVCGTGDKIQIHTLHIKDMLLNDPKAPVTFDGEYAQRHYGEIVANWRAKMQKIVDEVDRDHKASA